MNTLPGNIPAPKNDGIARWWVGRKPGQPWEIVKVFGLPSKQHTATFAVMHGPFGTHLAAAAFASMENKHLERHGKEKPKR